jgi:hypothetical protein
MEQSMLQEFLYGFRHNLFKPLLLFFYMGFSVPLLRVAFEFPYVLYQGLTIFLLVAIGWHGGEELAALGSAELKQAIGFMVVGFVANFIIGIFAYLPLRWLTKLRRVDAATVAAYYGSDSAGTFVTCLGVLASLQAVVLASGLSAAQIKPLELGLPENFTLETVTALLNDKAAVAKLKDSGVDLDKVIKVKKDAEQYKPAAYMPVMLAIMEIPGCLVGLFLVSRMRRNGMDRMGNMPDEPGYNPQAMPLPSPVGTGHGEQGHDEPQIETNGGGHVSHKKSGSIFSPALLHEVFLNPGLFLLFGGIFIGYISRSQGNEISAPVDPVFINLFQGMLCLFLLEMGLTASKRLKDLKQGGIGFIAYGLIAPNFYATFGMFVAHGYSYMIGEPLHLGTYVVFAVLCAAASYIAVPAIQRLAIPEASPTLPLAASLGLTFSYNVTIGIQVYIVIAKLITTNFPIAGTALGS